MPRELDNANYAELLQEVGEALGLGDRRKHLEAVKFAGLGPFALLPLQENFSEHDVGQEFTHMFHIVAGGEIRG